MRPVIGSLVVGLTDPQLIVGLGFLILSLTLIRVRSLLRQPQEPQRTPRRSARDHAGRRPD
jgi:hypothetical protein